MTQQRPGDFAALVGNICRSEGLPRWMPGRLPMLARAGGSHGLNPLIALVVCAIVVLIGEWLVVPVQMLLPSPSSQVGIVWYFWLTMPLGFIALVIVLLGVLAIKRRFAGPFGGLGLLRVSVGRSSLIGGGVAVVALAIPVVILMALGHLRFSAPDPGSIAGPVALLTGVSLLAFVIQSTGEELLVRGWLLPELMSRIGAWGAILISSLVFSALHLANDNVTVISLLNIALVGVFFCLMVVAQGALWGACVFHFIWNWAQSVVLGIEVSGVQVPTRLLTAQLSDAAPGWLTGGAFGVEGSVLTSAVLVALCVVFYRAARSNGRWADLQAAMARTNPA